MTAYVFVDAEARHRQYPSSFGIPRRAEINDLRVGDYIKVAVEYNPRRRITDDAPDMPIWVEKVGGDVARNVSTERFWVELRSVERGKYHGVINNDLVYTAFHDLHYGDAVSVECRHIMTVMLK